MSINRSALLKAAGIGILLLLLFTGLRYALTASAGINPAQIASDPSLVPGWYLGLSLALSCVGFALYLMFGMLYGMFANRSGTPIDVSQYAMGGALTGALIGLVSGIISLVMSFAQLPAIMSAVEQTQSASPATMQTAAMVGILIGVVMSLGLGAILGAIGGAVYAAMSRRRTTSTMPPPAI